MAAATSEFLARSGVEPGLIATIVLSALLHGGAVVFLITVPGRFLSAPTAPVSYTVDLVAPDAIGGTNLVPGKKVAPKMPPAPVAAAPVKVAEPKALVPPAAAPPVEPPAAKAEPLAPPPKAPEPAKVEPPKVAEPVKPVAAPKPVEPPKPERVKPVEAAKPAVPAEAVKVQKPAPVAKPEPKPAEPKPAEKPAQARAPEKAPEPKTAKQTTEKPAASDATKPAKPEAAPKSETKAQPAGRDQQIADAVQRRAAQVQGQERAASEKVDQQIAAAVQRRAQQVQQGAGTAEPGGPISVGPGTGSGGTPADLQYILYQGRMEERIKAAWAWAGADKKLQAIVQFNLTPEGEIRNVRTIESSGDRQYDSSCERAVRAVAQLDPIPDKYREDFATVQMTFKPTDIQ